MTNRKINVDVYRPRIGHGTFANVMQHVLRLPNDRKRNDITTAGHPIRLSQGNQSGKLWSGEVIQIRMDDQPFKAGLDGDIEPIELRDDQGIGQGIAFLYSRTLDVIFIQRNKFAVSATSLARYFSNKGGCGAVIFDPIMTTTAYQRLFALDKIKKFSYRIGAVNDMTLLTNQGVGITEMGTMQRTLDAPYIEFTASVGSRRGVSLEKNNVRRIITKLLGLVREGVPVEEINVKGQTSEDTIDAINMLDEFLHYEIDVEVDKRGAIPYDIRANALLQIFTQCQTDLPDFLEAS